MPLTEHAFDLMHRLVVERTQSRQTDFPAGDGPDGRASEEICIGSWGWSGAAG
jgi:hypothetical protein